MLGGGGGGGDYLQILHEQVMPLIICLTLSLVGDGKMGHIIHSCLRDD